jgi:polysaccharide pyruvyl transferase WcaK-like protein
LSIPLEFFRWIQAIDRLRDTDMLIMTGTGMLGDFGIQPFDLHYEILKWCIVAKIRGCKIAFLSVGVGPLREPLSRRFVKAALRCADYRSYRDQFSIDYLKSIDFDAGDDRVFPDLAYSFPVHKLPIAEPAVEGNARVVGIGLMTYFNRRSLHTGDETIYKRYIANMARFAAWLLQRKYTVRLLIGDATYDHRARHDLKAQLEELGVKLASGQIIDEPAASVDDVMAQLAATDIVVASRFHNVLLALMLGKPTLAVSYHEKVDALMAEAGQAAFCQDIESIDVERMAQQFTMLEEQSENIRRRLQHNADEFRAALDEQYSNLLCSEPGRDFDAVLSRAGGN